MSEKEREDAPGTSLTVAGDNGPAALNVFGPDGSVPQLELYSSIPFASNRARVLSIIQGGDDDESRSLKDAVNIPLRITDIVAHSVEMADTITGEVIEGVRIVLVDADGTLYSCVSKGIQKSVQLIMAAYGMPPWSGGLRLVAKLVQTRLGRTTMKLVPLPEESSDIAPDGDRRRARAGRR